MTILVISLILVLAVGLALVPRVSQMRADRAAAAERGTDASAPEEAGASPGGLRERLGRTRRQFGGFVGSLRPGAKVDDSVWDGLEEALLTADVGVGTTDALLAELRDRFARGEIEDAAGLLDELKSAMKDQLEGQRELAVAAAAPSVWLFVGVNGVGKTTTIGKVARRESQQGRSLVLAGGDTFRAAAMQQLAVWADRTGADQVLGEEGGDPSSVIFDAVQRAGATGADLVLADTAGRLHNKSNLMEELRKVRRVADRDPGTVTEVLLVLDATTGQNGLAQAEAFTEAVEVTGVVLTKLDGSAKGGIVFAIHRELGVPVKLVGIGEGVDDLIPFDRDDFVEALFA